MPKLDTVQLPQGQMPIAVFPPIAEPILPKLANTQAIQKFIPVINWAYSFPQDPFSLSFREYSSLAYEEASELQNEVYRICSDIINDAWRRGKRQVVICDRKIVYQTESIEDIPNEKVDKLARKYDKACYIFSAPDIIEESVWVLVNGEDYYPTISMYLGAEDLDASHVTQTCEPISADFDTGNPGYKIFDANQLVAPLSSFTPPLRTGNHLGKPYTYFQKRARICVKDTSGKVYSIVRDVRLVKDWKGSALLQVSPNRTGYVGRDILRDLAVRVELDPIAKISRINGVSS